MLSKLSSVSVVCSQMSKIKIILKYFWPLYWTSCLWEGVMAVVLVELPEDHSWGSVARLNSVWSYCMQLSLVKQMLYSVIVIVFAEKYIFIGFNVSKSSIFPTEEDICPRERAYCLPDFMATLKLFIYSKRNFSPMIRL